ncbi:related to Pre-mRNA-splicing factor CWC21 [Cephalotrichum gorgonifer]|uniref:Related to Pre-mRNA-splicing factor CWC21 n=1 Tax=Cephalotrichum gorgonifer TaxID=2041049 RepID=A0AAE8SVR3_9PEZI|nr:related to Pre-mRNA-splicing factor CWC21 [Cephalotrichum gorgonifer]
MSSNVGLSTPRGSGTSGHIQRNLAFQRPRDNAPYPDADRQLKTRQPDKGIMEHTAKRNIAAQVFNLRVQLEDEGLDEEEIDARCDELEEKLVAKRAKGGDQTSGAFKKHEVHGMADAKIKESEKLRSALGISKDYREGDHWRRQEERMRGCPAPAEREERRDDLGEEKKPRREEWRADRRRSPVPAEREYRRRSPAPSRREEKRRSASPVEREDRRRSPSPVERRDRRRSPAPVERADRREEKRFRRDDESEERSPSTDED